MTFASSTLQIQKHEYLSGLNIVVFADICTLSFYVFNMNVVSLFANSSPLLATLNLFCIDVFNQFKYHLFL